MSPKRGRSDQQRPTMEVGKRQLVDMPRIVIMSFSLSILLPPLHPNYPTPHSTAGEASSGTRGMIPG
jgi:hypothetical protein